MADFKTKIKIWLIVCTEYLNYCYGQHLLIFGKYSVSVTEQDYDNLKGDWREGWPIGRGCCNQSSHHLGIVKKEGTPQIRNSIFAENFVRKGGEGGTPQSVTYFLDQKQVFFGQKTPFLALF